MKKSVLFGFIIFAVTILGIYFSYQKYQRDHYMQGIGNYQIPTSPPSKLEFINNLIYERLGYIDYAENLPITNTPIECLSNNKPFYYREVDSDVRGLIGTLTVHKEVLETDEYRASLPDLEKYIQFYKICQTTNKVNGDGVTRLIYLFFPFDFKENLSTQKFKKPLTKQPAEYDGGGGGTPTYLAVVEKTIDNPSKEIRFFLSKKSIESETAFIKQIFPYRKIQYSNNMAYFTCKTILGVSDNLVYVGCTGTDGAVSARGLIEFNLLTLKGTEKVSCISGPSVNPHGDPAHQTRCVNDEGQILKQ